MIVPSSGYMEPQHGPLAPDAHSNVSNLRFVTKAKLNVVQVCLNGPYSETGHHQRAMSFGDRSTHGGQMNRLEALVAVATSGENSAR